MWAVNRATHVWSQVSRGTRGTGPRPEPGLPFPPAQASRTPEPQGRQRSGTTPNLASQEECPILCCLSEAQRLHPPAPRRELRRRRSRQRARGLLSRPLLDPLPAQGSHRHTCGCKSKLVSCSWGMKPACAGFGKGGRWELEAVHAWPPRRGARTGCQWPRGGAREEKVEGGAAGAHRRSGGGDETRHAALCAAPKGTTLRAAARLPRGSEIPGGWKRTTACRERLRGANVRGRASPEMRGRYAGGRRA